MNTDINTPSEEILALVKSIAAVEALANTSRDCQQPSHYVPYVPPRRYRFVKCMCAALVIALAVMFLAQSPTAQVREGRVVPVLATFVTAPFSGHFKANPSLSVGVFVTAGQQLGFLENRPLNGELAMRRADLVATRGTLGNLREIVTLHARTLSVFQGLFEKKAASRIEVDHADNAYKEAMLRLAIAEAEVEHLESNIERLVARLDLQQVRSPGDGVLLYVRDEYNDAFVGEGMQLFQVGSHELRIRLQPSERVLHGDCSEGDPVIIELRASGRKFHGVIAKIYPQVQDNEVGPYRKEEPYGTILVNPSEPLPSSVRPGMHVRATLTREESIFCQFWRGARNLAVGS